MRTALGPSCYIMVSSAWLGKICGAQGRIAIDSVGIRELRRVADEFGVTAHPR